MRATSDRVFLVEEKYDKIRLESVLDAVILTTEGFGIFKDCEKRTLLRAYAQKCGLVVLTDPDGAGAVIRNHIQTITGGKGVVHLYIPPVSGKEKRKSAPSREGVLGVEGTSSALLLSLLEKAGVLSASPRRVPLSYTKADLFRLGFSGKPGAEEKRKAFLRQNGFPENLSAKSLLDAVNLLGLKLE